jgi:hypothetical protein
MLALECSASLCGLPDSKRVGLRCAARLLATPIVGPDRRIRWPTEDNVPPSHLDLRNSWCHGNPGIALAAAVCTKLSGRGEHRAIRDEAMRTLGLPVGSRSLCCGSAGHAHIALSLGLWCEGADRRRCERLFDTAFALASRSRRALRSRGLFRGELGWRYLKMRAAARTLPLPATGL